MNYYHNFTDNNQFNKVSTFRSLYNGNIASWSADYTTTKPTNRAKIDHLFEYDYTNRLLSANAYNRTSSNTLSSWASASNTLVTNYLYDRNGNIINMQRYDAGGNILDNLEYNYNPANNQLNNITDAAITGLRDDDLESQTMSNNYSYDASGNLISDNAEGINNITWTPDGKVHTVKNVKYLYDASGNRIMKRVDGDNLNTYTIYARDANSQVMAVYSRTTTDARDNETPTIMNCITMEFMVGQADCRAKVTLCGGEYGYDDKGNIVVYVTKQGEFIACAPTMTSISINPQTVFPQYDYTGTGVADFYENENNKPGVNIKGYGTGTPLRAATLSITVNGSSSTATSVTITPAVSVANINTMPKISEWHIYGNSEQGRFSIKKPDNNIDIFYLDALTQNTRDKQFFRILGSKEYEIKDHLGNVRVAITDFKQPATLTQARGIPPFIVDERSVNDYYPFGMLIPERSWSSTDYRYGYNGKENDNEVKGTGNSIDYGARIYDSRVSRFQSPDPLQYLHPWNSTYNYAENSPILFIDEEGKNKKVPSQIIDVNGVKVYTSANDNIEKFDLNKSGGSSNIEQFAEKMIFEVANSVYKNYQLGFSGELVKFDKNGKRLEPTYNDIYGNKISQNEIVKDATIDAALTFIPIPKGFLKAISGAFINGVKRTLISVSRTYQSGKHLSKVWNKEVIKSTANGGFAKFKPEISKSIETIDLDVISTGMKVPNSDHFIKDMGEVIGATNGRETQYVKTYYNTLGEIHSVPISQSEFLKDMKKVKESVR